MKFKLVRAGGLVAAALIAAACGADAPYAAAPSPSPTYPPTVAPIATSPSPIPSPKASGKAISVANTRLGQILVGPNGRTIYLFLADSGTTSNCNSAGCVQAWPPVLTTGAPQAGAGVNASLLGAATEPRRSPMQVTLCTTSSQIRRRATLAARVSTASAGSGMWSRHLAGRSAEECAAINHRRVILHCAGGSARSAPSLRPDSSLGHSAATASTALTAWRRPALADAAR